MRTLFLAVLFLPLVALSDEVRITVGMSRDEAVALIQRHSGKDITSGLEVMGPKGEWPLTGIFWEFKDYDAIIAISNRDGKITRMTYWTKKDFSQSKGHRDETEQRITTLKIDTQTRAISLEKTKP